MNKWMWCSVGFTPKDVGNKKCKKHERNAFGCSRCKDFKLISVDKIIENDGKINE